MSAIVKSLLGAVAATAILTSGATAQDMTSDFFSELTSDESAKPKSEEEILSTIEKMMQDVSKMQVIEGDGGSITIEEIDRRNREAQRLKNDIALRELRFSEMKAQVEMLLTLNDAKKKVLGQGDNMGRAAPEIDEDEDRPPRSEEEVRMEAQANAEQAAAMKEEMSVPRVIEIRGSGGQYEAVIVSVTGVHQDAAPGDILVNGFKVNKIDNKGVTVEGMVTGSRYFIAPSGYAPEPQGPEGGMNEAIDLSTSPFPGVF